MRVMLLFALLLTFVSHCAAEMPTTLPTTRPITSMDQLFDAVPQQDLPLRTNPPLDQLEKATRSARLLKGRTIDFRIKPTSHTKTQWSWSIRMENTEYIYKDTQIWLTMTVLYPFSDEATAKQFTVGEASRIAAVINKVEFDRWKKQLRLHLDLHPVPDPAIGH